MTDIKIKRAYEEAAPADGYRILVDRLWPRGVSHERLDCKQWAKNIAPSNDLREWFHEDPDHRWNEFMTRYRDELKASPDFVPFVNEISQYPVVTFVYGAHDELHNNAVILREECIVTLDITPINKINENIV